MHTKKLQCYVMQNENSLIFKGYENLVVEHVGDNGLKIKNFLAHSNDTELSDALEISYLGHIDEYVQM